MGSPTGSARPSCNIRDTCNILAHPTWARKARADYLGLVQSHLAQYASIPMNGWERSQLVNFVLMPRWMHRLIHLPSDRTFHRIDTMISEFVRKPKGMDTARNHHLLGTPVRNAAYAEWYDACHLEVQKQ